MVSSIFYKYLQLGRAGGITVEIIGNTVGAG